MLIDATYGRKTASIFIMDSDHVILSALPPEKLAPRGWTEDWESKEDREHDEEGRPSSSPAPPASGRARC